MSDEESGTAVPGSGYPTDAVAASAQSAADGTVVRLAGRVVLWRRMGGLIFGHLQDRSGRIQISLSRNEIGADAFKGWVRAVKVGDFIGVAGSPYTTRHGERTIAVSDLTLLNRTVRALPDKWQGMSNVESRYRRRYLDLLVNTDSRQRFYTRAKVIQRRSDTDPTRLDLFQVVVNGWEIVKSYSELIDPAEQRLRLEEQAAQRAAGDDEAMMMEEDFIEAMEYGMPPMSGLGVGIDRLVALLTDAPTLREVVLFPAMRGTRKGQTDSDDRTTADQTSSLEE